ncbi:MAG: hypothetical protein ACPL07_03420, partial [Candidatus Bathyarchaeia archaeon]
MLNLQTLPLIYLLIEYVLSATIIVALAVKTIRKLKLNMVTLPFCLFAIFIALWAFLVFFHRIAEDEAEAITLFKIVGIVHPYIYGFYFLTFLNIWRARLLNLLCLIPSFVGSALIALYVDYGVNASIFGWSYYQKQTGNPLIDTIIYATTIIIMLILIFTLIYLLRASPSKELKRKFLYILVAFVIFQAIGVPITNLFLLQSNPNFPPLGGFFYLANLIVIYFQIQPTKEKNILTNEINAHTSETLIDAIKQLYNNLSPTIDTLGTKYFRFLNYLREYGLADIIKLENDEIKLVDKERPPISSDQVIRLIEMSLTLMEKGELDHGYTDSLI